MTPEEIIAEHEKGCSIAPTVCGTCTRAAIESAVKAEREECLKITAATKMVIDLAGKKQKVMGKSLPLWTASEALTKVIEGIQRRGK